MPVQPDPPSIFAQLVDLCSVPPRCWVGERSPEQSGIMFGGQFLAQGLAAAYRTVGDDRHVHSLHAYFVRPGDVAEPTTYEVADVRDGRSFSARSVTATQHDGRELFRMLASFHVAEDGLDYQPGDRYPIEQVPPPEQVLVTYDAFTESHRDIGPGEWDGARRPMDIRYVNPPGEPEGVPVTEPQLMWLRIVGGVPADRASHDAGLAYLADSTLVDHVVLPHGYRWQDARLTGTSLDHAMWFHRPADPGQWLLYDQRVQHTGGARGLATGRFYTASGDLVATCTQEGLMRWDASSVTG